jgi:hypothetical protein
MRLHHRFMTVEKKEKKNTNKITKLTRICDIESFNLYVDRIKYNRANFQFA